MSTTKSSQITAAAAAAAEARAGTIAPSSRPVSPVRRRAADSRSEMMATAAEGGVAAADTRGSRPPSAAALRGREARGLRRADALIASGQIEKALTHLRKLVIDLPHSTPGYLRIASLLREKKRADEARDVLKTAVAAAPASPAPREALAEVCLESGRWEEAILHSRALLTLSPRSLFARDVLSAAYLQRGFLDQALRVTEEMIRIDPADAANHFKRGVLLQQKGLVGAAVSAFCRVLSMDADPDVAAESRAALEMLDGYQIRQILTLAVEDIPFRVNLRQDAAAAITEKGYLLSEAGLSALCQISFDDLPGAPAGWRHYHYH